MPVKQIDGKWHTVNKAGKVGKRGFSTKSNAEAASARGKALLGQTSENPSGSSPDSPTVVHKDVDTTDERRALGIPELDDEEGW